MKGNITGTRIIVDRETGVHYLFCWAGFAGGITSLLDKDGKPVIALLMNNALIFDGLVYFWYTGRQVPRAQGATIPRLPDFGSVCPSVFGGLP